MGDCVCINLLTYEEKLEWLDKILASRFPIHNNTEKILIISHVDEAKCGLNNLGFLIKKGINVTCLCALKELNYDFQLRLSSYFLSTLKPISHVKTFMKKGILPKILYDRKPKTFVHLPYFEVHSLLNLFVPFPLPYTLACNKPQEHLNVTIEVDL